MLIFKFTRYDLLLFNQLGSQKKQRFQVTNRQNNAPLERKVRRGHITEHLCFSTQMYIPLAGYHTSQNNLALWKWNLPANGNLDGPLLCSCHPHPHPHPHVPYIHCTSHHQTVCVSVCIWFNRNIVLSSIATLVMCVCVHLVYPKNSFILFCYTSHHQTLSVCVYLVHRRMIYPLLLH